jgi:hypothetical protein
MCRTSLDFCCPDFLHYSHIFFLGGAGPGLKAAFFLAQFQGVKTPCSLHKSYLHCSTKLPATVVQSYLQP